MDRDWRDALRVGDVIAEGSGLPRVVRAATYNRDGFLRSVSLTIRRCSWTGRCYTVLNRNDLKWRRFVLVGGPVALDSTMDRMIVDEMRHPTRELILLRCCDVKEVL